MNAQAILQKIEDDARAAAQAAKDEAQQRVQSLKEDSSARLKRMHDDMIAQAGRESEELAGRMRRMAELDGRKLLLQAKRDLIDEAFAAALDALCAQSAKKRRAFFLRQAVEAAAGTETLIVGANAADWYDAAFLKELNKALAAQGKPGKVTASDDLRQGVTGLVLSGGGTEVSCTLESLLDNARGTMETEVAQILFEP
ncbi:MAG TPA: V-type ATP synthase subunit E [Candidatus Limiplasma stercoravium]|nr:V-type ATP synthase subunit E [Candidatus Limiplasma stercoravium]